MRKQRQKPLPACSTKKICCEQAGTAMLPTLLRQEPAKTHHVARIPAIHLVTSSSNRRTRRHKPPTPGPSVAQNRRFPFCTLCLHLSSDSGAEIIRLLASNASLARSPAAGPRGCPSQPPSSSPARVTLRSAIPQHRPRLPSPSPARPAAPAPLPPQPPPCPRRRRRCPSLGRIPMTRSTPTGRTGETA